MHVLHTGNNADELLNELLVRREKMLRNRRYKDNIILFIKLLSHYIPRKSVEDVSKKSGLYEYVFKKHGEKPCGGYAVRIAIEKLPGKVKRLVKK
ncbi:MAG: hypothetical protein IKV07_06745 [Bacteroidaceae bacterium]|nr:hypothetical protein [Bacteroidaceae bacterium]